jgi:hypothetical protein
MFALKPITPESIPDALKKAERYRLLNEPMEAASICRDVLEVEPGNQKAIVWLMLSLTDQFGWGPPGPAEQARQLLARLDSEYDRAYYSGIISERQAKALIRKGSPRSEYQAYERLAEAMQSYEQAERLRPPGNDDAILRWNTCVRILESHPNVRREPEGEREALMLE